MNRTLPLQLSKQLASLLTRRNLVLVNGGMLYCGSVRLGRANQDLRHYRKYQAAHPGCIRMNLIARALAKRLVEGRRHEHYLEQ